MRPLSVVIVEQHLRAAVDRGDGDEIDRLAALLDTFDHHPRPELLASALWYATIVGLKVFPLTPRSKIPLKGSRGCLEATTNERQILDWWARTPDANLGIATGHLVDVIDIDGPVGVKSWAQMDHLPPVLGVVSTPRPGGNHLYVPAGGRGNKAGIFPSVDYRGAGGYVVAPPSVNDQGTYRWTRPLDLGGGEA